MPSEFKCISGGCDLSSDGKCIGDDCRYCSVYNKSESILHNAEMETIIPKISKIVNEVCYLTSYADTVARFLSVDDAKKVFRRCVFYEIGYAPHEMYVLYPNFFRIKSYLSLGVPRMLLGNGEKSPLISVFSDGCVYTIAPVVNNSLVPK